MSDVREILEGLYTQYTKQKQYLIEDGGIFLNSHPPFYTHILYKILVLFYLIAVCVTLFLDLLDFANSPRAKWNSSVV